MIYVPTPRPSRIRFSCRTVVLLGTLAAVFAGVGGVLAVWGRPLLSFFRDTERVAAFTRRWGDWAPFVTVALHVAQVIFAPIPGQALDAVNGFLFGPWLGTLFSLIGLGIGSTLAMGLARCFGRPLVERFVDRRLLARLDGFLQRRGALFVFLIFLFPFLPDDAVCFLAGLTPIPLAELVLLAVVGRLPGIFVANWVGASAAEFSPLQWGLLGAVVLVVAVAFWRFQERIEVRLVDLVDQIAGWWGR